MFGFRNIGKVKQALSGAITRMSEQRAVQAQVRANGGAMNLSAQSSVQSQAEAARRDERAALLGHAVNLNVVAPDAPHLESQTDESPYPSLGWPFRRRRSSGQSGKQGHKKRR